MGSGEWGRGKREWGMGSGEWGVGSGEWGKTKNHTPRMVQAERSLDRCLAGAPTSL
ncbi:MAG: hypothetical protein DSM106950_01045 [Stigonema ocellatum SAG 48.90 = DSM 106950]|nr:hypothetical protein [Stigonema ocellatum SAG 48.90 = DSM 106950]